MNTNAGESETSDKTERTPKTPKLVLVGLGGIFLSVIAVPCCWFYLELASYRAQQPAQRAKMLTAEQAKSALVNMVKQSDDGDLKRLLPALEGTNPAPNDGDGVVDIGRWSCDLRNERFSFNLIGSGLYLNLSGVFSQDANGIWIAKVTGKRQT
jgi:hypothetical protein